MSKILVVLHIYCVNDWYEIAEKQIQRLVLSGLYDSANALFATLNVMDGHGTIFEDGNKILKLFSKYSKFEISFHKNECEYSGIKKTWDLGQNYDAKILYFHTKGVSNKYRRYDKKEELSDLKIKSIEAWKECMEHFLIDNWRDCIDKLNEYDNVGVTCNNGWFWGNFWWSQTNHLKTKKEPSCGVSRWYYEAWLNEGSISKNYEYYKFIVHPYRTIISKRFYDGSYHGMINNLEIISAYYGSFNIQSDEGRKANDEIIEIDVSEKINEYYSLNKTLSGIPITNDFFGEDPHNGVNKQLRINFKVLGFDEIHEIAFDEYTETYLNFI